MQTQIWIKDPEGFQILESQEIRNLCVPSQIRFTFSSLTIHNPSKKNRERERRGREKQIKFLSVKLCIELWVSAEILQRRWDCRGGSHSIFSLSLKRTETELCVWWVLFIYFCICMSLFLSLFLWLIIQSKFFGLVKDSYDPMLSMQRRIFFDFFHWPIILCQFSFQTVLLLTF